MECLKKAILLQERSFCSRPFPPGIQEGPVSSLWTESDRIRDLRHCFQHPIYCHNCSAVNCFLQTLDSLVKKFDWMWADKIEKWFNFLKIVVFNFDRTGIHGLKLPLPDLYCFLYYWITGSISCLRSPLSCSPWDRKGHQKRWILTEFYCVQVATCSSNWQTFPAQETLYDVIL